MMVMVVTLKVGLYLNPLIGYEKTNPKSKLLYHMLLLLRGTVVQSIKQRIGFIKVTTIVGMTVGYLSLMRKLDYHGHYLIDGYMVELSSHIIKLMTHTRLQSK